MRRADADWGGGFALLSSRCSYELVEKAALSNCPLLVTISAPTRLAAERARAVALPLVVLARADALLSPGWEEDVSAYTCGGEPRPNAPQPAPTGAEEHGRAPGRERGSTTLSIPWCPESLQT